MSGYCVLNLGCKVNRVESDHFEKCLYEAGLFSVPLEDADVVVVNTCTVTGDAEKKARKLVRSAVRSNGRARIIVTGCASAMAPDVFRDMSDRIEVVPKAEVCAHLSNLSILPCGTFEQDAHLDAVGVFADEGDRKPFLPGRSRIGVKIQDGCDNECSYCIVCKARGASKSTPHESVVQDVLALERAYVKEILLTGIDLGAYRDGDIRLADLLFILLDATRQGYPINPISDVDPRLMLPRFRISSIEPGSIDRELVHLMAASEGRICRHLHIPLQSGSNKVLSEMGRHYDVDDYVLLIDGIKREIPMISITTDVIVGFPGETDEDFNSTMDVASRCGFSNIHVFPYSKRFGTVAAARSDQIPVDTRSFRAKRLRNLARELRAEDAHRRIGEMEVYCVQEDGNMMSESYYERKALEGLHAGELIELPFSFEMP